MGKFKQSTNWKAEMLRKRIDKVHYKKKLFKFFIKSIISFEVDKLKNIEEVMEEVMSEKRDFEHDETLVPVYSYFRSKVEKLEETERDATAQLDLLSKKKAKPKFL